jgi:methanogenic corrinoid protein MtbC1
VSKRWASHSGADIGAFSLDNCQPMPFVEVPDSAATYETTRAKLADIISGDVIPRLLALHHDRHDLVRPASAFSAQDTADLIDEFSAIVVSDGSLEATDYFENLRERGASLEVLFEHLIGPTARRLGQLWEEDVYDFVDVARGIGCLQQIIRHYGCAFGPERERTGGAKSLLLAVLPGERHTLGLSLIREFFCREGWNVDYAVPKTMGDLVALVKSEPFDGLGLSASVVSDPVELAADIRRIRSASRRKPLTILVGGRAFAQRPGFADEIGADGAALTGEQAVELMSKLTARRAAGNARARSGKP